MQWHVLSPDTPHTLSELFNILLHNRKIVAADIFFHPPNPNALSVAEVGIAVSAMQRAAGHITLCNDPPSCARRSCSRSTGTMTNQDAQPASLRFDETRRFSDNCRAVSVSIEVIRRPCCQLANFCSLSPPLVPSYAWTPNRRMRQRTGPVDGREFGSLGLPVRRAIVRCGVALSKLPTTQ